MGRKGQSITLSISENDKAQLEAIALEQGMLWGNRPNISRLMEAIARREILINQDNHWSETRIRALQQSMRLLIDSGQTDSARIIANLLSERTELSTPFRNEIERFLENPVAPWRLEIDQYIRRQTPFQLAYRDAADRPWTFTIHYAQIRFYEKREYLECWCEETEGNRDISALQHNWTLRLDRIPDAALRSIRCPWRQGMDTVNVEMNLAGGLAFAYESRPEDKVNEWLSEVPQTRRVIRQITNTFWFFREILPYGKNCVVTAPNEVHNRFREEIQALYDQYNLK